MVSSSESELLLLPPGEGQCCFGDVSRSSCYLVALDLERIVNLLHSLQAKKSQIAEIQRDVLYKHMHTLPKLIGI